MNPNPLRIISLVPSITELLYDLGLREEVVGITKFCVHPTEWFRTKERIGGTKTLNLNKIIELKPDLILANKEENVKEQVYELSNHCHVYTSDVKDVKDALHMIQDIGQLCGKKSEALHLIETFQQQRNFFSPQKIRTAIYLIWQKPYMAAGVDTLIHSMMEMAGFQNVIRENRYPEITMGEIQRLQPDYLLLSSEPFPFKQKHVEELALLCPYTKPICVDGEIFSWYGSRMLKSFDYFSKLNEELA